MRCGDLHPEISTLPTSEEVLALVASVQQENAALGELVHELRQQNQALRDEIAVLNKQKQKP